MEVPMVGARVIGASPGTASVTIDIDRGQRDGIKRNMGVITPDGVVGKVIEAYANTPRFFFSPTRTAASGRCSRIPALSTQSAARASRCWS